MKYKIFTFIIALISLAGLGLVYGWSIFVVPLESEFGWPRSESSITFTVSMMAMCLGIMLGGQFNKKNDRPVMSLMISAALILSGFALTSSADKLISFVVFYGVFCGFGVGFAYVEIIAVMSRWFTKSRGVITGLMMMLYGMGAMIFGTACSAVMDIIGWRTTFIALGILFGALLILLGLLIAAGDRKICEADTVAGNNSSKKASADIHIAEDVTSITMIRKKEFIYLYVYFVLLSAAGLAVMGHIAPCVIEMGTAAATAALIAGATSTSNGIGRIIYGSACDKFGVVKTMRISSFVFLGATLIAALGILTDSIAVLTAGCCLLGMSFGSVPVTSSIASRFFFGGKFFSANFGIMSTQLMFAAIIGPFLAGQLYTASGTYSMTFYTFTLLGVLAIIITSLITKAAKKIA